MLKNSDLMFLLTEKQLFFKNYNFSVVERLNTVEILLHSLATVVIGILIGDGCMRHTFCKQVFGGNSAVSC